MSLWYRTGHLLNDIFVTLFFSFKVIHSERMIEEGGVLFAMNHVSYLDPPFAAATCRKPVHYLARKTLISWPILGKLMLKVNVIPVDQERAEMKALKTLIRLLRSGERAFIFPEGARSMDGRLQPGMPGIGLIVAKTLVPVVPIRVFGAYEAFPRGAKTMKMYPVRAVVGEPIFFKKEDIKASGKKGYAQISNQIMAAIAAIELPEDEQIIP